ILSRRDLMLQLLVMLATAMLCGYVARRLTLPAVIGELFGGILLGPTVLNLFHPTAAIAIVAKIGVISFLFVAGLEVSLHDVRRNARAVVATSLGGILLPFA